MQRAELQRINELAEMVGRTVYVSDWVTVTQEMIDHFAAATGDYQWLHVDVERARRESPYGRTIAHGHLTGALIARFAQGSLTIAEKRSGLNYGSDKIRYLAPVKVDSRVRGSADLIRYDDIVGGAQLFWKTTVEIEGEDRPACVAETITRAFR